MHGALELLARCGAVERSLGERRIIRIAHDVLDALHVGAHLLQRLHDGRQRGSGSHELRQVALERQDHAHGELALQHQVHARHEHGGVGHLHDQLGHQPQSLPQAREADLLRVETCLEAGPTLEIAALRAGGLDGLHHFDAGNRGGGQLARIAHLHSRHIHALRRDQARHAQVYHHRRYADGGQQRAVGNHHHGVQHQQHEVQQQRRQLLHQRCGDGGVGGRTSR